MSNAQNGARIKTWAGKGVGSGIVKNITFTGFVESNVDNPVVIDQVRSSYFIPLPSKVLSGRDSQCYETSESDCAKYPSNTLIEDIWFDKYVMKSTLEGNEDVN